jgi:hypothetical protein
MVRLDTADGRLGAAIVAVFASGGLALGGVDAFHVLHAALRSQQCEVRAGGRCAGPEPMPLVRTSPRGNHRVLVYGPALTPDGRTLLVTTMCGGALRVKESPQEVVVTYVASDVGAGGMTCALVPLRAQFAQPLGGRPLFDGVTHQQVWPVRLCRAHEAPPNMCVSPATVVVG